MAGYVALVLHAHLPYVRHPEAERSLEERWLYEAIAESYLPLVDTLDRLTRERISIAISISLSPTLVAMLRDTLLCKRFEAHLGRLEALAAEELVRARSHPEIEAVVRFHRDRLHAVRAIWTRIGGDVVGALSLHRDTGRIELFTTTATHAYLPGLVGSPASVRAQLRLGRRAFQRHVGGVPLGLWLPECAFEPRLEEDIAGSGARLSVLDAHGLELALPRPPFGALAPILSPSGVAFFGRDASATREVWSRDEGYPGHADYRDFYRDIGFDRREDELCGEIGPGGTRVMTGLKYHRVTGPGPDKALYDPRAAAARAAEHAADFVRAREAALATFAPGGQEGIAPVVVAPYDAELFGHWWFEGPLFVEHVLRTLQRRGDEGGARATTLRGYLERYPELCVARPAASTWGQGGFGGVWTSPRVAHLWRHTHHAGELVRRTVEARRHAEGAAGRALEQSIRELLLLQASDWAFMIDRGEAAEYAEARVQEHTTAIRRLVIIASSDTPAPEDAAWAEDLARRRPFLAELGGEAIRDAFDPW